MTDKKYPSDLTDEEWGIVKEILNQEEKSPLGRPVKVELRRMWDAINDINKTGCQWAYLPHDFPPYTTVNYHYMKWTKSGFFEHINHEIRRRLRKKTVEEKNPLRVLSDSQTVKGTSESAEESGFDGGKHIKGRKRHIVVDTIGCILMVVVHSAQIYDSKGALLLLKSLFEVVPTLRFIWADQAYKGSLVQWVKETFSCKLEVIYRTTREFQVLPRRWVVERTFAWLTRYRRLVRDYEKMPASSVAMVYAASIRIMLKKLCPLPDKKCRI